MTKICVICGHVTSGPNTKSVEAAHGRHILATGHVEPEPPAA